MSEFIEEYLTLKVPQSGDIRVLLEELTYYSNTTNEYIVVPIGFETDLGSIPNILQGIFPKDGKAMFAYILHDWLYKSGQYSRSVSDEMLEEAMECLNVGSITRKVIYSGLRIGGWVAWNEHRKGDSK